MKLVIINGSLEGSFLDVVDNILTIGKSESNKLTLNEDGISGRHAFIEKENGSWTIFDVGSTNGVFHNGQKIEAKAILQDQDLIKLGVIDLRVELSTPAAAPDMPSSNERSQKYPAKPSIKIQSNKKQDDVISARKSARQKAKLKSRITSSVIVAVIAILAFIFYPKLQLIYSKAQDAKKAALMSQPKVGKVEAEASKNHEQAKEEKLVEVIDEMNNEAKHDVTPAEDTDLSNEDTNINEETQVSEVSLDKYKNFKSNLHTTGFQSLLKKHCIECHNPKKRKGDVDLTVFKDSKSFFIHYETLVDFYEQVESKSMPPEDDSSMTDKERQSLAGFLGKSLYNMENTSTQQTGSTKIRRLTKYEYDNTVKAVTGLDLKLSKNFAADGAGGEGFSNDSAILGVSPLQFEQYLEAAEQISSYSSFDLQEGFTFSNTPKNPKSKKDSLENLDIEIQSYVANLYPKNFTIKKYLPKLMKAVNDFNKAGRKTSLLPELVNKYKINKEFLSRGVSYFSSSFDKSIIERDALRPWFNLKQQKFDSELAEKIIIEYNKAYRDSLQSATDLKDKNHRAHLSFKNNISKIFTFADKELMGLIDQDSLASYQNLNALKDFLEKGMRSQYRSTIAQQILPHIRKLLYKAHRKPPEEKEVQNMAQDFLTATTDFGLAAAARLF
ncbi:MAG: DUF1587 domain-containing protein, partial [Lentisphaeraceae bacterium]|nr:DUF1587 domain-containing protein [Lentisphaeraceae bacterium]